MIDSNCVILSKLKMKKSWTHANMLNTIFCAVSKRAYYDGNNELIPGYPVRVIISYTQQQQQIILS